MNLDFQRTKDMVRQSLAYLAVLAALTPAVHVRGQQNAPPPILWQFEAGG
jgi:hypothetical protein